jgi:ATP-dependent 26S proteasome regulatory subunit
MVKRKRSTRARTTSVNAEDEELLPPSTPTSESEEAEVKQPRVKKQKQSKRSTKTNNKKKNTNNNSKKKNNEKNTAFLDWQKQLASHFEQIDQQKLVDDSKDFFKYVDTESTSNSSTDTAVTSSTSQQQVISDLDEVIQNSLNESCSQIETHWSQLDDVVATTPDVNYHTSTVSSSSSSFIPSVPTELRNKYPTLYNLYIGYCKAIKGIVEPCSFLEFMEQQGF